MRIFEKYRVRIRVRTHQIYKCNGMGAIYQHKTKVTYNTTILYMHKEKEMTSNTTILKYIVNIRSSSSSSSHSHTYLLLVLEQNVKK